MTFAAAVRAVNDTLSRRSARHGGMPCPAGPRAIQDDVLAACDLGCFDDAVPLLERIVDRLGRRGPAAPHGYLVRVVRSALGELHRDRRRAHGLQQRPERVPDAAWAHEALPDPADRALLAHLMTWLGSDVPAVAGTGWPLSAWADRYGTTPAEMAAWIRRVMAAVEATSPRRHRRYLAGPLADKAPVVPPVSAFTGRDARLDGLARESGRWDGRGEGRGDGRAGLASARPLWPTAGGAMPAAETVRREVAGYRIVGLTATVAGLHGTGAVAVRALRAALVEAFGPTAARAADDDLADALRRAAQPAAPIADGTGPASGTGPADCGAGADSGAGAGAGGGVVSATGARAAGSLLLAA
ncbi:hypothetical protein FF36_00079 [Frankia torreyi]|uniref:Uncharacterized protein n=1 Tax=Frankia torreyi TaxID=1856 RepID=A0A0D8BMT3_9ACTN|nr:MULTISPECIES: hypothetical protein [unclassified Frankia]KJE25466.1 hypothetical protein FF36_00079 [Frankia torreyi]KQM04826.1 hypothetical protein FF86_102281 [Frankia sp. CpI1-P]